VQDRPRCSVRIRRFSPRSKLFSVILRIVCVEYRWPRLVSGRAGTHVGTGRGRIASRRFVAPTASARNDNQEREFFSVIPSRRRGARAAVVGALSDARGGPRVEGFRDLSTAPEDGSAQDDSAAYCMSRRCGGRSQAAPRKIRHPHLPRVARLPLPQPSGRGLGDRIFCATRLRRVARGQGLVHRCAGVLVRRFRPALRARSLLSPQIASICEWQGIMP
jgi:hypothetical protein